MATTRISRAQKHKSMIVKTADGARTSVSIPEFDVDQYVVAFYSSHKLFRRHLNAAAKETSVRPGRSFSQGVRLSLDRRVSMLVALN
jgi:hypothetical protein